MLRLETLDEGTRTRILRVAAGLSQHDLAARAGIDRRRLSEHERGERSLPAEELTRVSAQLAGSITTSDERAASVG
jgi:transcriptional regulator with XRE-family HTH domain